MILFTFSLCEWGGISWQALMLLLDEHASVLTLVINSIQKCVGIFSSKSTDSCVSACPIDFASCGSDLHHENPFINGLALSVIANIGSDEMIRDLHLDVERHLQTGSPYTRKKVRTEGRRSRNVSRSASPRTIVLSLLVGGIGVHPDDPQGPGAGARVRPTRRLPPH